MATARLRYADAHGFNLRALRVSPYTFSSVLTTGVVERVLSESFFPKRYGGNSKYVGKAALILYSMSSMLGSILHYRSWRIGAQVLILVSGCVRSFLCQLQQNRQ